MPEDREEQEGFIESLLLAVESELGAQARRQWAKETKCNFGLRAREDTHMSNNNKSIPRHAACRDPLADLSYFQGMNLDAALDTADILDNGEPLPDDAEDTYTDKVLKDLQEREGLEAIEESVREYR